MEGGVPCVAAKDCLGRPIGPGDRIVWAHSAGSSRIKATLCEVLRVVDVGGRPALRVSKWWGRHRSWVGPTFVRNLDAVVVVNEVDIPTEFFEQP